MKYEEEYQLKKQKLWRPLTVGTTAMMLAAPVYAEEIQTPAMGADTSVTQTAQSQHRGGKQAGSLHWQDHYQADY